MKVLPISCRCKLSGLVPHLRQQMTISYSARQAPGQATGQPTVQALTSPGTISALRLSENGLARVLPLHLPPAA